MVYERQLIVWTWLAFPQEINAILLPAKDEVGTAFLVISPHPLGRDADRALSSCYCHPHRKVVRPHGH